MDLLRDSGNMAKFAADFFPPNFRDRRNYLDEMLGDACRSRSGAPPSPCSWPCRSALLCSANIVPVWVYQPARRILDACRAINEMVFAMLFIVAVGLGPVRRRAGDLDPHHRRAGQAVRRSRGSHRPAPWWKAFAPPAPA